MKFIVESFNKKGFLHWYKWVDVFKNGQIVIHDEQCSNRMAITDEIVKLHGSAHSHKLQLFKPFRD